jgi:tRNA 2-thiouridine synthesizing protein B
MLYTVNKSPFATNNLESALGIAPPGAPILLYEDGVYAAVQGTAHTEWMQGVLADHPVYALQADLQARGLAETIAGIQVIDYDGFVQLVEQHDVAPWL